MKLSVTDHDRAAAGMTYAYPVLSRRSRGVSLGVNLNPNRACNWRCIYCQVPGLVRGSGPAIDLQQLEDELRRLLDDVLRGDFMERRVPAGSRRLNDVALSGDGEPTSSPQLGEVVELIGKIMRELELLDSVRLVLITNGSLLHRPPVAAALERISQLGGEVWFKLDSVTPAGLRKINSASIEPDGHIARLRRSAELCTTRIQTCVFAQSGVPPSVEEQDAYLACLRALVRDRVSVRDVLLYTLARPSHQPEAPELSAVTPEWLSEFAAKIEAVGVPVELS